MKTYKLRSEYDCLIKTSDEECLLDVNSQIIFEKPEQILVYPINNEKNLFPFSIDLGSDKKSPFFQRYIFNNFDLVYISSQPYIKNESIEKINIDQKEYRVHISQNQISFETPENKKSFSLTDSFNNYDIATKDDLILLKLTGKEEVLWLYNTKTNQLNYLKGNKIEKIDDNILVTKNLNLINRHEIFQTFELKDNQLIKKSEKLKSHFDENLIRNPNLIPFAFLEAIKLNDFDLARIYLSENLSKQATDEHLIKYFGNFTKIIPLENNILGVVEKGNLKLFKFLIKDNKISEIDVEN